MNVPTGTRQATAEKQPSLAKVLLAVLLVPALIQCITVSGQSDEPLRTYVLDIGQIAPSTSTPPGGVLMISNVRADTGVGSIKILYVERAYEVQEFRNAQWAERPDRMLHSVLLNAAEASGQFDAVVESAYGSFSDLRLDTTLMQLQQEFFEAPSQARVRMRAQVIDLRTQEVLGTRFFEETEPALSDDPYGGVAAMNIALGRVVDQIVAFAVEMARNRSQ